MSNGASGFSPNGAIIFNKTTSTSSLGDSKNSNNAVIMREQEQEEKKEDAKEVFVDRSAQLSATLNSLAVSNAARFVRNKDKRTIKIKDNKNNTNKENKDKKDDSNKKDDENKNNDANKNNDENIFSSIKRGINIFYD